MKKSKYNKFFEVDGKKLAFNGLSCGFAQVDDDFFRLYNNIEKIVYEELGDQDKQLIEKMKDGCYIMSDAINELETIKFRNNKGKFSGDYLSLVIAPTMACNFACSYCYESPKPGIISQEVQDKLVSMVKENAEKKRRIDITWYGGEPLLLKDIIYGLSGRFIKTCEEYDVNYNAGIITNGYLINEEDVGLFRKFKINGLQITIDGPESVHNRRRFLKSTPSEGTYAKIMENVRKMYDAKYNISLRINIDKKNIDSTKGLILEIKKLDMMDLFINFGHVAAYTDKNQGIDGTCLAMDEYAMESLRLQEFLFNHGFRASGFPYYPGIKANYCGADSINTFVIDPEGYKYKCWNEVGEVSTSVGNIMWDQEEYTDEMISREISYMTWSPLDIGSCRECFLLPICMGGCPYSGKRMGEAQCERWKYSLMDVLHKTYEQKSTA